MVWRRRSLAVAHGTSRFPWTSPVLRPSQEVIGTRFARTWHAEAVIREPVEAVIREDGSVELPMGIIVEAGLSVGSRIVAFSDGDGRIVLRREADAVDDLLNGRPL